MRGQPIRAARRTPRLQSRPLATLRAGPTRLTNSSGEAEPQSIHELAARALRPAFAEIRNVLTAIQLSGSVQRVDGLEREDAAAHATQLEELVRRLIGMTNATEAMLAERRSQDLACAVHLAMIVAEHVTRVIGGVRWASFDDAVRVPIAADSAAFVIAAALARLAEQMPQAAADGIELRAHRDGDAASLVLRSDDLSEVDYASVATDLRRLLGLVGDVGVGAGGDHLRLTWRIDV
jgi:hypothetical protein